MMEELLGQVMAKLLEAQIHEETEIWSPISLCQSRSKYARKEHWREEKQSEENRGQQLQSSCALLEHFPKSIFYIIYTISKLRKSRIQYFKRCAIRSWNEEVAAIASQSLPVEWSIFQSVAKSPFCCEVIPQPFCTVGCISSWRCPTYTARGKLGTSRWKPTSQPCEDSLVLWNYFAALLSVCEISQTQFFSCEMVPEASRNLLLTLGDIFH